MIDHSANAALLSVREQLGENLSSSQIERVLDTLIFKSLDSLIQNTRHMDYVFIELLYHLFHNMRRKFSNTPHEELRDTIFTLIVTKPRADRPKVIRKLRLERSIYFRVLKSFEEDAQRYVADMPQAIEQGQKTKQMQAIEAHYRTTNPLAFYNICCTMLFWVKRAFNFRNMVVEKFIRLAYVEAQKARAKTGLNISFDDLYRNMVLSIPKAIDKYDSKEGPLTTYVKCWFMDARNSDAGHEEGVAYSIPLGVRRELLASGVVNIYTPIDKLIKENQDESASVLDILAHEQDLQALHNLAIQADTHKVFSLLHGLNYSLSEQEKRQLQATLT